MLQEFIEDHKPFLQGMFVVLQHNVNQQIGHIIPHILQRQGNVGGLHTLQRYGCCLASLSLGSGQIDEWERKRNAPTCIWPYDFLR